MAVYTSHPSYAMAARHTPGIVYALAFFVCMAVIALAFMYFVQHGFFLVHIPTISFRLPDLHLTQP